MSTPDDIRTPERVEMSPPIARGLRQRLSALRHGGLFERARSMPASSPDSAKTIEIETGPVPQGSGRGGRLSGYRVSFIACVILPAMLYLVYLFAFASDQYVALTRFAVRTAAMEQMVELPTNSAARTATGGLPMVVGQDAYLIVAYINSHKILEDLSKTIDLTAMFRNPRADFWTRLKEDASAEDLLAYWRARMQASVDGPSGIVTVRVRAFTPEDALSLLRAVVAASETLANEVSARARRDSVERAEQEVERSVRGAQEALEQMRVFRERMGYIDPVSSATITNTLLLQMLGEKIRLENEIFVMSRVSPDNATGLRVLRTNMQSVEQQIQRLMADLTGASEQGRSISAALVEYERLELQRLLSQKMLTIAQEALARAHQRAERQSIFITSFVPPSLPEEALYPERRALSLLGPLALLICWGVFAFFAAMIQDHRE